VLGVARSIGLEYDEFFAFAYPEPRPAAQESASAKSVRSLLEDIMPSAGRLGRPIPAPASAPTAPSRGAGANRTEIERPGRRVGGEGPVTRRTGGARRRAWGGIAAEGGRRLAAARTRRETTSASCCRLILVLGSEPPSRGEGMDNLRCAARETGGRADRRRLGQSSPTLKKTSCKA
jgi:hypothetical protein